MLTKDFRDTFPEAFFGNNDAYEIIEECYRALDCSQIMNEKFDAYNDANYVNTARKYTSSLFIESANRLEDDLLRARDEIEAALNGYLLNYIHTLNKYRGRVRTGASDLTTPIYWDTYEFPQLFTFPKQDLNKYDYKHEVEEFVSTHLDETDHKKINESADNIIRNFTEDIFGEAISSNNLNSLPPIIAEYYIGDKKTNEVNSANLMLTVQNIQKVQQIRKALRTYKDTIPGFYKKLRDLYTKSLNSIHQHKGITINNAMYQSVPTMQNPTRTILLARANATITVMDLRYNQIFMAYARVFHDIVYGQLNAFQIKINCNITLCKEIMEKLNLLAALPDPKNTNSKWVFIKR